MRHFGKFAKIFAHLRAYRRELMKVAGSKGWPLMRPMAAHYAYDEECWKLITQYLFGEDFLVSPVLEPARRSGKASTKQARQAYNVSADVVSTVKVGDLCVA